MNFDLLTRNGTFFDGTGAVVELDRDHKLDLLPATRNQGCLRTLPYRLGPVSAGCPHRALNAHQSITATPSISISAPGTARQEICTRVLAGGLVPKNSWRTSP
jgi:hypothetical protein